MRRLLYVTPLLLGGALTIPTAAQEKEHPIVTAVKASVKDTSKPFTMLVHIKIKDGAAAQFESAFRKAIVGTRRELGNLAYDLNRSAKHSDEYLVYERWANLAALQKHLETPHIRTVLATTASLRAGTPQVEVLIPVGE